MFLDTCIPQYPNTPISVGNRFLGSPWIQETMDKEEPMLSLRDVVAQQVKRLSCELADWKFGSLRPRNRVRSR